MQDLQLRLDIPKWEEPISLSDRILLVGSCFTENMAERLEQHKMAVLTNPNGILFNPLSVASVIEAYAAAKVYEAQELFYLNELWNSWQHHTRFSDVDKDKALSGINAAQSGATQYLENCDFLILTLGTAFQYYLKEEGIAVANNHRAPAQWFEKRLLAVDEIVHALEQAILKARKVNPRLKVVFTVSPVRHIRDGVVANNRSKARLLESAHQLCEKLDKAVYFPAYELIIDILRDYRFYDIDFVHPNFLATSVVWEHFQQAAFTKDSITAMQRLKDIHTAFRHRTRFPETEAHQQFLRAYRDKCLALQKEFPNLNLNAEIRYFSSGQ